MPQGGCLHVAMPACVVPPLASGALLACPWLAPYNPTNSYTTDPYLMETLTLGFPPAPAASGHPHPRHVTRRLRGYRTARDCKPLS